MKKFKQRLSLLLVVFFLVTVTSAYRPSVSNAADTGIIIDGQKDAEWNTCSVLAAAPDAGWQGFQINNLELTNDASNLYFWIDATNVPNWGDNGQAVDIALNVNDTASNQAAAPWSTAFNFSGTAVKPNYHILLRVKNDTEVNGAAVYSSADFNNPLLASWGDLKGAAFAVDRTKGFEGKIPLSVLGLKSGDTIKVIAVLSGNNGSQHGAFSVLPEASNNKVAGSWDESANADVLSTYSNAYTVSISGEFTSNLYAINAPTQLISGNTAKLVIKETTQDGMGSVVPADNVNWTTTDTNNNVTDIASIESDGTLTANNLPQGSLARQVKITASRKTNPQDTVSTIVTIIREQSPKINDDGTVTFYAEYNGPTLNIVGSMNGWNNVGIPMVKNSDGFFTATIPIAAGQCGYKFFPVSGSWDNGFTDALNANPLSDGNSVLNMPGLGITSGDNVKAGESLLLSADFFDAAGVKTVGAPTWSLKEQVSGVTLTGNELKIGSNVDTSTPVTVIATQGGYTAQKSINILTVMYTYTINYYRPSMAYTDWSLWMWQTNKDGVNYVFNKSDSAESGFTKAVYQFSTDSINFIVRDSAWNKDIGSDRTIAVKAGTSVEVWLVQDDPVVHYSRSEVDTSSKITSALMDSSTEIFVTASGKISDAELNTLKLTDVGSGSSIPVAASRITDSEIKLTVSSPEIIDVTKNYTISSQSFAGGTVTMRHILDDAKYYYSGTDLGLTYSPTGSTFKLWAPTAAKVSVCLYNTAGIYGVGGKVEDNVSDITSTQPMLRADNGVWSVKLDGDLINKYYMYKIEFGNGKTNYAVDPYASSVSANGQRTAIVDVDNTSPAGWGTITKPTLLSPTDSIIYELHIRDFSSSASSGIANKGKLEAFTETGTTVPGTTTKTGIDSLKELGITHVHLLPTYDYGSVNEKSNGAQFNWGYDPVNYNVPEGSYSTDADNPAARVMEFKDMVQALHKNGIRVIMDVVYNHTYATGGTPFDAVVPGYYYRTDAQGKYTDGSGCGNEVASERPMVRKYIKDSVNYWATKYGVDGFRFDLMGIIDTNTIKQITKELRNEVDPSIMIYGEPWTGGGTSLPINQQTLKGTQKDNGFAVFNDNFRGALKGGSDDATKGFITGATGTEASIVKGVRGSIEDFTNGPSETINYITAHDNLNLWDKILTTEGIDATIDPYATVNRNAVLSDESVKRDLLGTGIILTSQGIPFFQAGDEFLKSKYGNKNSYNSPDSINSINWNNKIDFKPVFDYYQGLIELRKTHPAFRMNTKEAIEKNLQIFKQDGNIVIFELKNYANGDPWKNIVVIYNANKGDAEVTLPNSADWKVVVDNTKAGTSVITGLNNTSSVTVGGLSTMVLYDEAQADYIPVATTIDLNAAAIGIGLGDYKFDQAVVRDQKGSVMPEATIDWSSSNTDVATVDKQTGKIYGKAYGTTTITATFGEAKATISVTVAQLVPTSIEVSGATSLFATMNITLAANVKDQFEQDISNPNILWSSSDKKIATVNAFGVVSGVSVGSVIITAKCGEVAVTKNIAVYAYVKKYIQFNYVRADKDYDGWNIWTWQTGVKDGEIDFTSVSNGIATVKFEIAPDAKSVGFVLRKGTDWAEKDAYGSDRYITIDQSMIITKATITSGVGDFFTVPAVKGAVVESGNIKFTYRNEQLYENDSEGSLDAVKVKVNGSIYDMNYDETNQYYTYTLKNIQPGVYDYSFLETNNGNTTEVLDPTNNIGGKSTIEYKELDISIAGSVTPSVINSNQNALVTLNLTGVDANISSYREIDLDLSEVGGPSKVKIDPILLKQTIGLRDNVASGDKNIPITVVDINGEEHKGKVTLTVTPVIEGNGPLDFSFDEASVYFVVTDRFLNGDTTNDDPNNQKYDKSKPMTYHGGDFKGLTSKIDYLKDLGINTIWITPIVEQTDFNQLFPDGEQYSYHGYWAKDFEKLDSHLGTLEDFKALIDKAHDNGIKIMVDVVLNHAGYGMKASDANSSSLTNYPTVADRTVFSGMFRDSSGSDAQTQELSGLPDFKTEDPAVRAKLIAWQTAWIQNSTTLKGNTIDYFRVDTVKNVDNTTWKDFKNAITEKYPTVKLLGEYYNGDVNNNGDQLNDGQMDGILDFGYKSIADSFVNGSITATEQKLEDRDDKINNTAMLGQFLGSHDEDGFLTRGDIAGNLGKLKVAASLQITDKGIPVIYYGEELAASGVSANDGNRYDMPWSNLDITVDKSVHDHYQKLLNIRKNYSAIFAKGTRTKLAGNDEDKYIAFERAYNNEAVVVALNVDTAQKTISIKTNYSAGAKVEDLYNSKYYTVDPNQEVSVTLPSMTEGGTVVLALAPVYSVVFNDKTGRTLKSERIAIDEGAVPPSPPTLSGYIFTGWDKNFDKVTSDMVINATYMRASNTYNVTVIGGKLSTGGTTGDLQFDMPVKVVANASSKEKFSYWELNGRRVSVDSAFTFYVPMGATTLKAVYNSSTENTPFITLLDNVMLDTANNTMTFTAVRAVPSGYTLLESGIILAKSSTPLASNLTVVDTENTIKGKIDNNSTSQFYIRKLNCAKEDTWYARAYLTYRGDQGPDITVYSNTTISETMGGNITIYETTEGGK